MIKKYEDACREAMENNELTAEEVKEIRRFLDGEKQKVRRQKEYREKHGMVFNSLQGLASGCDGIDEYELSDPSVDIEEMYFRQLNMERLQECLEMLSEEDRTLILTAGDGDGTNPPLTCTLTTAYQHSSNSPRGRSNMYSDAMILLEPKGS